MSLSRSQLAKECSLRHLGVSLQVFLVSAVLTRIPKTDSYYIVTPLDVVRVRLQSQPASSTISAQAGNLTPSALSATFSKLPPNLGVTACCREVFWMNNTSYCIAPTGGTIAIPSDAASCAAEETQRRTFNSTLDGLRKIARNEGLSTLWRGLSPTLAMAIPANVIYFTGYDFLRYSPSSPLVSSDSHLSVPVSPTYIPLVAGSVARVIAATVISPIEMFRTRLQATSTTSSSSSPFAQTLYGLRDMVRTDGAHTLWRGLSLTLWRDVPFSGLYWWGYESIFHQLQPTTPNSTTHASTFTSSFIAGCLSGAAATIVTMPFDVGKTRQQTYFHASSKDALAAAEKTKGLVPEELSIPRFLLHIYRTEGIAGLWKGWAARLLKVSPACGIMIASYEVGKVVARTRNQKAKAEDESSG